MSEGLTAVPYALFSRTPTVSTHRQRDCGAEDALSSLPGKPNVQWQRCAGRSGPKALRNDGAAIFLTRPPGIGPSPQAKVFDLGLNAPIIVAGAGAGGIIHDSKPLK